MTKKKRLLWALGLWAAACVAGIVLALALLSLGEHYPDLEVIKNHKPKLFTKVYDAKGRLIDIISLEQRVMLEYSDIPEAFVQGLVATEDKAFFQHVGVSPIGILVALKDYALTGRLRGASTLTQQLVKNITQDSRNRFERKFKEQLLALQLEKLLTKEEILATYANQIALGNNQFGIQAAANFYFGKQVGELSLGECAILAGIPQAPSRFNPYRNPEQTMMRRDHVLNRMRSEGYIDETQHQQALAEELVLVDRHRALERPLGGWFVDKIRSYLFEKYGEETVRTSRWDVFTTLDLDAQRFAEQALRQGIEEIDKRQGFRPQDTPSIFKGQEGMTLEDYFDPSWHRPLHAGQKTRGLVEKVSAEEVEVRVHRERFTLTHESMPWVAKSSGLDQLFQVGDVPLFEVLETAIDTEEEGTLVPNVSRTLLLDQEPTLQGGLYALNTKTGAIVAMVGGYDYRDNKFNMAEQALRQVGSAFKPFLYGAAFEHGYTLADLFLDEPTTFYDPTYFELREGEPVRKPLSDWVEREILLGRRSAPQLYTPRNYHERNFNGLMTMRKALAQSKNIIAVKLLNELGYDKVFAYLDQLSLLHPSFQPFPSMALGSFEMTLADLTHAYSAYATNGIRFEPLFVQKIVDEKGRIIEDNAPHGRQVVSPENAFLVCSAMQSVIGDPTGTGRKAQSLGMPLAGKTGTTNDYTDAWFIGFHPDLAVGVWVGHHTKLPIGDRESGPKAALPIWISFMEEMKKTKQLKPGTFVPPPGIVTFQIDELTGKRFPQDCDCDPATKITEFFLQGEGPVDRCRQDEQLLMSEPWFLQKDSFSYDPAKMAFAPAVIRINVEAQKRALHYLDTLMEQGNP